MTATPAPASPDPTMEAIGRAVTRARAGDADDVADARRTLSAIWDELGVTGDPVHRCALAHHLADLYVDPARALAWDVRALDAAGALTEQRAQEEHASLHVAGFYPSLHLNLADDYRRLGAFDAALEHISAAEEHSVHLPPGPYGDTIRTAVRGVAEAIARRDTARRPSAPGVTA